jgi:pyrroline-5-carboxylate reductase
MAMGLLETRIAFIGGGHMGGALAAGLLARGVSASALVVSDPSAAARARLADAYGIETTADNASAVRGAGLVILAVKPQTLAAVVPPLAAELRASNAVVLSIAAGVRVRALEFWCGPGIAVVRAMPNRPALVGAGAAGLYAPATVDADARRLAEATLRAVGGAWWVAEEALLDAITALSGSGPAYFFLLAECMAEAGVELGLDLATAQALARATLAGAGALAGRSDVELATLRAEVTSKGGTTEAALRSFGERDLRGIVLRSMAAAAARSRELADQAHADGAATNSPPEL